MEGICSFILCKSVYIHLDIYAQKFHEAYSRKYYDWQPLRSRTLSYLGLKALERSIYWLLYILFCLNLKYKASYFYEPEGEREARRQ